MATRSDEPVFRCDDSQRVVEWNGAAARLTGLEPAAMLGRACWDAIRGRDDRGRLVCRPSCETGRAARAGRAVSCGDVRVATPRGELRLRVSTIVVEGAPPVVLHPFRPAPQATRAGDDAQLTPRQLEVLRLLADGIRVREIARRLVLSEKTVRNHVRAILAELRVHSQLEAVAKARAAGLA